MTLNFSSMKSSASSLLLAGAVTVAVVSAAVYAERKFRRRRNHRGDGKGGRGKLDFKDGSQESLVNERFQACVQVMGPQLPRLSQHTQLDYYGLFKQGTLGDYSEYLSEPPPSYDLVATAKYRAWAGRAGMDRMTAMQNYIDKAIHFQFTKHIEEGDDHDYEMEGDPAIDMWGLGDKPSTLADEYDKEKIALEDSQYPIHAAAREGKLEELKKLIELSSSPTITTTTTICSSDDKFPNTLDESGQTPLHLATDRGHIDCVKALILAGADINSVDNDGISILQAAVIGGDKDCSHLLLVLGANPDQADNDGDTPRDSAQDDDDLKELFQNYDDKTLVSKHLLDPEFLKELQQRNIPISIPSETTAVVSATSKSPEKVDVKAQMKILDEGLDFDLDDDGDMF
jgi:acyl-CoA-binding protein